jgi:hypothetical protein
VLQGLVQDALPWTGCCCVPYIGAVSWLMHSTSDKVCLHLMLMDAMVLCWMLWTIVVTAACPPVGPCMQMGLLVWEPAADMT